MRLVLPSLPVILILLLATPTFAVRSASSLSAKTAAIFLEELAVPEFTVPEQVLCGSIATFNVSNPATGADTEIYRSLSEGGEFTYRYTLPAGETRFIDERVTPRTKYYYRIRSTLNGEVSAFSEAFEVLSGSGFFSPVLDESRQEDRTFMFTFEDHSYADASYEVYKTYRIRSDEDTTVLFKELILPDSGSTTIFYDRSVRGLTGVFTYIVNARLACQGDPTYYGVAGDTLYKFPYFEPYVSLYGPPDNFVCGNEIDLELINPNDDGRLELYRSTSPDDGFELIHTVDGPGVSIYYDKDLGSQKTYYYKAFVVGVDMESGFSETLSAESGAAFYPPFFTTSVLPDQTVKVTIQDRSYLDYSYEYYGMNTGSGMTTVGGGFQLPDSGSMYTFIDTLVAPGSTYTYHVNAYLNCDGLPYVGEFVSDPVTIENKPVGPAVLNFSLVTTSGQTRSLADHDMFSVISKYNIKANTSDKTASVEFLLNGKKYKDNTVPFTVFGDNKGKIHAGKLKAGHYTLTATAYSGKNYKGAKGNTLTVQFEVTGSPSNLIAAGQDGTKINVSVYPNPARDYTTLKLTGEPHAKLQADIVDQSGNVCRRLADKLNGAGTFTRQWDVRDLGRGTYFVRIEMGEQKATYRLVKE
jgi:hypothetical protein